MQEIRHLKFKFAEQNSTFHYCNIRDRPVKEHEGMGLKTVHERNNRSGVMTQPIGSGVYTFKKGDRITGRTCKRYIRRLIKRYKLFKEILYATYGACKMITK